MTPEKFIFDQISVKFKGSGLPASPFTFVYKYLILFLCIGRYTSPCTYRGFMAFWYLILVEAFCRAMTTSSVY